MSSPQSLPLIRYRKTEGGERTRKRISARPFAHFSRARTMGGGATASDAPPGEALCRICWSAVCEYDGRPEFLSPTPCACRDERSNVHQAAPHPPNPHVVAASATRERHRARESSSDARRARRVASRRVGGRRGERDEEEEKGVARRIDPETRGIVKKPSCDRIFVRSSSCCRASSRRRPRASPRMRSGGKRTRTFC